MTTGSPIGQPGEVIVVEEHHLGEGRRVCEILEVLGTGTSEHYRVRWDDDRESIYFPGNDAHILRHVRGGQLSLVSAVGKPAPGEGGAT